jgi:NAD(P)-dependent dehydrogenase (short-subunit alcohol dehydrogenase family)
MQKQNKKKPIRPPQHQNKQPGEESKMTPAPEFFDSRYKPSEKLKGKVAVITGGDSGIGRSVAIHFASEGAKVVIIYLNEVKDAMFTKNFIREQFRQECIAIRCDIRKESSCISATKKILKREGKINILVNNAATHTPREKIEDISAGQLLDTFQTNVFSMFYLAKAIVPQMKEGDCIINTASVTAYRGSAHLLDYSSTKGAIVSFTRSLAGSLADRKIRVNAVAPGPVWTPLIPSSFPRKEVAIFGSEVPLKRAGQPKEIAPAFIFLASDESTYITGQVIHPNGGEIVNG